MPEGLPEGLPEDLPEDLPAPDLLLRGLSENGLPPLVLRLLDVSLRGLPPDDLPLDGLPPDGWPTEALPEDL